MLVESYEANLLEKLPRFHRKILEFQQIAQALDPEFSLYVDAINEVLDNMFIATMDETAVSRMESIVGIVPDSGSDLDARRFAILTKFNTRLPYTDETLEERIKTLCGEDNYIIIRDYANYFLSITTTLTTSGAFDLLSTNLRDIIPCNMVLELLNELSAYVDNTMYVGCVCNTAMRYLITHDNTFDADLLADLNYGTAVGKMGTNLITHDISVSNSPVSNMKAGTAIGKATTRIITNDIDVSNTVVGNNVLGVPTNTMHTVYINN